MKHWNEDDFKQWLYGLKEDDGHFAECAECGAERDRLMLERRRIVTPPEVSNDFLAAQRRSIYQRLGQPMRNWMPLRWALSAAAVLVVMLGVTLQTKRAPAISDEQLFSDLATMEQSAEPQAIAPIHQLFEE
jgi:hypothetical protein